MRMSAILLALSLLAGHPEADAAILDANRQPVPYSYAYLSLGEVVPADRPRLANVLRFVIPSLSSRAYLGDQLPQAVPNTNLLRIDLAGLGWEKSWPIILQSHYVPAYRPDLLGTKGVPLVVNGLWVAAVLTDSNLSGDAQYQLLYGTPPKTDAEFRKFWQVNSTANVTFGRIEGDSGVALQRARLIENHASAIRGYHWQTFDSRVLAGQNDPLENLTTRPPKHDASELIAAIPKHYAGKSGTLQAYFLVNGKGERQEKAPADIVTDSTGIRGVEIRNTLFCISCHEEGIRHPTLDQYREYILSGARIYTKDKATQQEIDRYLDSPIAKEITRNNEDYTAGVALCNGLTPRENALAFRAVVQSFDAPVSPEQAALELYVPLHTWRLALGNYSRTGQLTGRLALMAQGKEISREQWQANFGLAQRILALWHAQQ